MRAMLLAAGLGRRMLPLTLHLPKAALPVLGRPLAVQILRRLARHGIDRAVVNLHQHADVLRRVLDGEGPRGLPHIDFSDEPRILGTAGGLRNASPLLRGDGPILVHNSDSLTDIDIGAALETHRRSGLAATLVLTGSRPGYAAVDVDARGRVLSLAGHPAVDRRQIAASHLFTGCHIIEEEVLERIPAEGPSHIVRDVYRRLAEEGRLGHYLHRGFWWEFGSPGRYLEGCLRLLALAGDRLAAVVDHDPVREEPGGRVSRGPEVRLSGTARLFGLCALGAGSRVGSGSTLRDCVLFPRTRVGSGCRLRRTVVGPGAEIPDGFEGGSLAVCADSATAVELPATIERRGGLVTLKLEPRDP